MDEHDIMNILKAPVLTFSVNSVITTEFSASWLMSV